MISGELAQHRGWKQLACGAAVLAVLAARTPHLWSAGEFVAEDGWEFFARAWNLPWHESLVTPSAGYLQVLPRLVAEAWSWLPVTAQPQAFAAAGLLACAAILSSFYLPAFRVLLPSDAARLGVVALLTQAPNSSNLGLVLGLHWYVAFLLPLALLVPSPATTWARVAACAGIALAVLSSPSTYVLAPFAGLWLWRGRSEERLRLFVYLTTLAAAVAVAVFARATLAERTGDFSAADALVGLGHAVLRGWIGRSLLGARPVAWLGEHAPWVLDGFGLTVAATLAAWLWRQRAQAAARQAAVLLGSAVLMIALSLARTAYVARQAALPLPEHDRYLTAPTLLLYVTLALVIGLLAGRPRRAALAGAWAVGVLLLVSLPANLHWSRPAERFHLRDAAPAIERLAADFARDGRPASLYVPADIPYWGPVLEVGGGEVVPPERGLAAAVRAQRGSDGRWQSWLGRWAEPNAAGWLELAPVGRVRFAGLETGRVFLRDEQGRLLFTSPLLHPRFWRLDGAQWTLLEPAPGS